MPLIACDFTAYLAKILEAADKYMTLSQEAETDLLSILSNTNNYTYLTLRDNVSYETVKAYRLGDKIVIDRGLANTKAMRHPVGTSLTSISPTVMQALIQTTNDIVKTSGIPADCGEF